MTFGAALCRAQEALPVSPSTNSVEALPWAQREALAREILASPLASGPAESTSLALVSYREAGAWAPFDAARATSLYRQSFLWARGANIKVQEPLETAILNELLFLSPSDVAELLPSAGTETRNRLFANLIIYWLYQGTILKQSKHSIAPLPKEFFRKMASHSPYSQRFQHDLPLRIVLTSLVSRFATVELIRTTIRLLLFGRTVCMGRCQPLWLMMQFIPSWWKQKWTIGSVLWERHRLAAGLGH